MSFVLAIVGSGEGGGGNAPRRAEILRALDVDDDGSLSFEIGRPETGATCVLVQQGAGFEIHLPLLRSPTSATDLLPSLVGALAAIGAGLIPLAPPGEGQPPSTPALASEGELISAWTRAHEAAASELFRICEAQGSPPPPHLPRAELLRLHAWLVAIAPLGDVAQPILGLDPADGRPVRLAVGLPDGRGVVRLPPVDVVLANVDGETRIFERAALGAPGPDGFTMLDLEATRARLSDGEPLGRTRVVSPVEIVDDEALQLAT